MEQQHMLEADLRLQHRHSDGAWSEMVEDHEHPNPAGRDEERSWAKRRIFRCRSCPESFTVVPGDDRT